MGLRNPARSSVTRLQKRRRNGPALLRQFISGQFISGRVFPRRIGAGDSREHIATDATLVVMKRKTTRTAGFTLMEMLLVIGLIAVFASMTLPSALRIYGRRKLTESAERVRAVAASARVHAIESGLVYQFCCEANGGHFAVVPFEPDHVSSGGNGQGGGGGGQNMGMGLLHRVSGHLPAGVIFTSNVMGIGGNVISTGGTQKISPTALEGLPNAGDLSSLNWSAPILFNADGSANADAHITVSDSHSQHILLRVRAFTGAVSMERLSAGKRK